MQICNECIAKYKGPAVDIAKTKLPKRDRCDVCSLAKECYVLPDRSNYKKNEDA